jgi:GT2 family glycosyltransferase
MRIAVLVTCYNRSAVTVRGLTALVASLTSVPELDFQMFIVDDGSSDDTVALIACQFPMANLYIGSGNLYWAGGMRRAFEMAQCRGHFDAFLLFNDDVLVEQQGIASFFREYEELNHRGAAILVGATRWEGRITYSGFRRRTKYRPLALTRVNPCESIQPCDTFNGNFVLVPGHLFETLGGLDGRYVHAYADIDLGYVAAQRGVRSYIATRPVGACADNGGPPEAGGLPGFLLRLRGTRVKMDSLGQRLHFLRKHTPAAVLPVLIAVTTARFVVGGIIVVAAKAFQARRQRLR